jgi:HTH-type transcriptional regulator/antitoxin HigA
MDIRLIGTEADYRKALAEIERLWEAKEGSADAEKLELLGMLVHSYERSRQPLSELDPIDAIRFRMEQQGLTRKDLLPVFGTTARVSEVLSGKRTLTIDMIRKLHELYDIPYESLMGRPATRSRSAPKRAHSSGRVARRRVA